MRLLFSIMLVIATCIVAPAQAKHLLFKTDMAYISDKQIQSGYKHLIALDNQKSAMLITDKAELSQTPPFHHQMDCIKNRKIKTLDYVVLDKECLAVEKGTPKWQKTTPKLKVNIQYTKKRKNINGYDCKQALIKNPEGITEIWYTEDIKYNHLFKDWYNSIPGTVVLAKIQDKDVTLLELLNVKNIDNKGFISTNTVESILKHW